MIYKTGLTILAEENIWLKIWGYVKPNDLYPYLVIAAIGIVFTLLIGDRKSFKDILVDIAQKIAALLIIYGIAVLIFYWFLPEK